MDNGIFIYFLNLDKDNFENKMTECLAITILVAKVRL